MGATDFSCVGIGKTAKEAFAAARERALYEEGHGGYTGTIAEKRTFKEVKVPEGMKLNDFIDSLIDDDTDDSIGDKSGPAGCIAMGNDRYVFFGVASE